MQEGSEPRSSGEETLQKGGSSRRVAAGRESKRVTVGDVARLAGTSTAVVSYVLNDGPRPVAASTRARVEEAIARLSYRPNAVARALRRQHTGLVGLVVPDASNPFFAELARVVEEELFGHGYMLLLGNSAQSHVREAGYVDALLESQVDGLLLIAAGDDDLEAATRRGLDDSEVALVLLDREMPGVDAASFAVDNEFGGHLATVHLLEHGHERIACLAGPERLSSANERAAGWRRAMSEAGIPATSSLLSHTPFDRSGGYLETLRLLRGDVPPTAIFATSDQQAIGAIRAAYQLGFFIPNDLAVVGFDGIPESGYTAPPLTTISQPFAQLGKAAVEALIDQIQGAPRQSSRVVLPVKLTARASCGCPFDEGEESA